MSFRACVVVAAVTVSGIVAGCSASKEPTEPPKPLQAVAESFAHSFYAGDPAEAYELQTTRCKVEDDLSDFINEAESARKAGVFKNVHARVNDALTGTVDVTFDDPALNYSAPWRLEGRDWRYDGCKAKAPAESQPAGPGSTTEASPAPAPTSAEAYVVECFPDAPGAARWSDGSIHFSAQCATPTTPPVVDPALPPTP